MFAVIKIYCEFAYSVVLRLLAKLNILIISTTLTLLFTVTKIIFFINKFYLQSDYYIDLLNHLGSQTENYIHRENKVYENIAPPYWV